MNIPFVDLAAQYHAIKPQIDLAIANVIADTAFISGSYARKFEEAYAKWLGIKHVIACANGTDAIEILLQACGIGPGDEVIVPANSWISTSEAVSFMGAKPIFADVDPKSYTIDPAQIEAKITARTKAIIPVHFYGLAANMDAVMAIAQKHNLLVIEDTAQAHGATWKGQKVGTIGHAATFSFYPGKNLGAYGDAGCMVTNDDAIAEKARMIANHGQLKKHDHQMEGRNSRLDGMQGAILSAKLPFLNNWTSSRQENAALYDQYLADMGIQLPYTPADATHVYHLYVVQVPDRDRVKQALNDAGVQCLIHYPMPLPFLKPYADRNPQPADFPVVHAAKDRILSLPMYPEMTEEMIAYVTRKLKEALEVKV